LFTNSGLMLSNSFTCKKKSPGVAI